MNTHKSRVSFLISIFAFVASINVTTAATVELEEIVVTAQKREQSLRDIPISIDVFNSDQLADLGANDLADMESFVPNLSVGSTAGSSSLYRFYLRGLGTDSFHFTAAAPVGVYSDGVYNGTPVQFGYQFMDVERIEVLKGPQGTLYGRNTTAGLINLISKKPVINGELDGYLTATAARFGTYEVEAASNVPLNNQLAARIAVKHFTTDGQYEAVDPGFLKSDLGGYDSTSIRGTFLFEANEQLTAELGVYYGETDGEPSPTHPQAIEAFPFAFFRCPNPSIQNDTDCTTLLGNTVNGDINKSQAQNAGVNDNDGWGIRMQLNYSSDNFDLVTITSYDEANAFAFRDEDGQPLTALHSTFGVDFDSFQQELRLQHTISTRLRSLVGASYYKSESRQYEQFNGADMHFLNSNVADFASIIDQEVETYAGFGELYFDVTDKLEFTIGFRVTHDTRDVIGEAFVVDPTFLAANPGAITESAARANVANIADITTLGPPPYFPVVPAGLTSPFLIAPGTTAGDDWTEWSGRVALNYRIDENKSFYASISRGFKGGETDGGSINVEDLNPSDPEFVTAYEIGTRLRLMDDRVDLTASFFYYDFEDQQVSTENVDFTQLGDFTDLVNAGKSTILGVEYAMTIVPADMLRLVFQGAYLDAEFDEFFDPGANGGAGADRSGNKLTYAPEIDFSTIVEYTIPFATGSQLKLHFDASFEDDRFFGVVNDPAIGLTDSYWKLGAVASYTPPSGDWSLSVWGRNLTDEEYVTMGFDGTFFNGIVVYGVGDRRTFGITGTYHF